MHDPYVSVGSLIPPYSMHRKNGNDEENMKVAALQRVDIYYSDILRLTLSWRWMGERRFTTRTMSR